MFASTQLVAVNFGFPDVCKVVIGPAVIPLPFPNFAMAITHIPNVFKYFMTAAPVHNLLTSGTTSNGDEGGAAMGVISNMVIGPSRYLLGSFKVFHGVAPAARHTSLTLNNGMNAPGCVLVPSPSRTCLFG